jgi:hypothetical protein
VSVDPIVFEKGLYYFASKRNLFPGDSERRNGMPAPMGTWNFFSSGVATPGTLTLSTSPTGTVTGTLQTSGPALPISAVWDETAQILSFTRATAAGTGANDAGFTIEVYTGTLFQPYATPNGLVSGEGVPLLLAGNFGVGKAGGGIGPFNQLGWFATNTVKFKEKEGKEHKDTKDIKDKDHKDVKEKEHVIDKVPADKLPELQAHPNIAHEAASAVDDVASSDVRISAGRSFISEEERPAVGSSII